jgi:hypothetical protein
MAGARLAMRSKAVSHDLRTEGILLTDSGIPFTG